jgi:hypothetical protein
MAHWMCTAEVVCLLLMVWMQFWHDVIQKLHLR